jgi:hypothetical protein
MSSVNGAEKTKFPCENRKRKTKKGKKETEYFIPHSQINSK